MNMAQPSLGDLLRDWRRRRRLSQLALAADAEISQRHLSFVESGRSVPSRDMIMRLADTLSVPLRDRNGLLVAAGFAPVFTERALDTPDMAAARSAIDRILTAQEPHPAVAVDRNWTLLVANRAIGALLQGVAPHLLAGPANVLRISLHPEGLASRIVNFRAWRQHILLRLDHEIDVSANPTLLALREELKSYPMPPQVGATRRADTSQPGIAIPLVLSSPAGPLSFISTTTVFGTAVDVTLSEIVIESFFPADRETAYAMRRFLPQ